MRAHIQRIDDAVARGDSDDGGEPLFHPDVVIYGKPPPEGEPFELSSASIAEAEVVRQAKEVPMALKERAAVPQFIWPLNWEPAPIPAPVPIPSPTPIPAPAPIPVPVLIPAPTPAPASIPTSVPASIPALIPAAASIPTPIPTAASIPASIPTSASKSVQIQRTRSKKPTQQKQQVSKSASAPTSTPTSIPASEPVRPQQIRSTQRKRLEPTDVGTPPARRTRSLLASKKD
ncbi:uncharacterized protein N7515_007145 [Penicillium bovifimosum]|uniref:Uncharacterized protein n=1 Tax=Penicillium bovifimosum TaxID=126998 RepID=A0A9W9L1D8_9EURO|nr:uncharacterized protein N7515_007145 [Penicillium bovifimosum]KAJ5131106.1 hypothetical protein N7515_007145 [Penicillium bovifimosum]